MRTRIQTIGDSKSVILPPQMLEVCHIEDAVDVSVRDGCIVLRSLPPRQGWFADYVAEADEDAWEGIVDLPSEQEEIEW